MKSTYFLPLNLLELELRLVEGFLHVFQTLLQRVDDFRHLLKWGAFEGVVNQAFGGYTSLVKARSSGLTVFKDDDFQSVLCCILGGPVTSGAASNDNQISLCH